MQHYLPLTNFLRHQAAQCSDVAAEKSINQQIEYLQTLHNRQLDAAELQRRAKRMEHLKKRWQATFVDNRPAYRSQVTRAVSKLTKLQVAA